MSIIGCTVIVNFIFLGFNLLKYIAKLYRKYFKKTLLKVTEEAPVIPVKTVRKRGVKKVKFKKEKAPIDESLYVDDGRY